MNYFRFAALLVAALLFSFAIVEPASSQVTLDSNFANLSDMDGDGRECRIKDWEVSCNEIDWLPDILGVNPWVAFFPVPGLDTPLESFPYWAIRTRADSASNLVGAAFSTAGWLNIAGYAQLSVPHYATSWVYKDIVIEDASLQGNPVLVQIAPTYSWEGGFFGLGNYEGRISLSIEVENSAGKTIGSFDLVERDRSGDITIGLELPSEGTSAYDRNVDTNHFQIMLERGETYRIYFKAEAHAAPLISGVESSIRAKLESIAITVPTDSAEQLAVHDADIKNAIAQHDEKISGEIASHDQNIAALVTQHDSAIADQLSLHDAEIKELLRQIVANQEETIKLLKTPEGKRPGWNKDGY